MFPSGPRLGARAIGGVVLLVTASAMIWVGTAFAGYALYLALIPKSSEPLAAAIAALILVVGPLGWATLAVARRQTTRLHQPDQRISSAPAPDPDNATLTLLAKVAQEKPLLAVLFAGILGASEAMTHNKGQM